MRVVSAACILFFTCVLLHAHEKPIVVFVPSYNNIQFYKKNLDSIFVQEYSNYRVVYIDDCSTDGTGDAVAAYTEEHNLQDRLFLIRNAKRNGAMFNHYMVAHAVPDYTIVATLDGDDWFPDGNTRVLARLNEAYQNPDVWMTYGQFQEYPSGNRGFCRPIPDGIKQRHWYRDFGWVTSHLRTFYAGVFKQIPVGYFIRDTSFLQATCDLAMMFGLLELSGGRAQYIDEVLYSYNTTNSNSDCYVRTFEQIHNDHWVRTSTPLQPLAHNLVSGVSQMRIIKVCNWHISTRGEDACRDYCSTLQQANFLADTITFTYDTRLFGTGNPHLQFVLSPDVTVFYDNNGSDFSGVLYQQLGSDLSLALTTMGITRDSCSQQLLLAQLDLLPDDSYIMLTTDGCAWRSSIDWATILGTLDLTKAVSYVATIGSETLLFDNATTFGKQPATIPLYNGYYLWKPTAAQGVCHHPYAAPAFIVHKKRLHDALSRISGTTLQELLDNLAYLAVDDRDDVVLCNAQPTCNYKG